MSKNMVKGANNYGERGIISCEQGQMRILYKFAVKLHKILCIPRNNLPRYIVPGLVREYLISRTRHVFCTTSRISTRYFAWQKLIVWFCLFAIMAPYLISGLCSWWLFSCIQIQPPYSQVLLDRSGVRELLWLFVDLCLSRWYLSGWSIIIWSAAPPSIPQGIYHLGSVKRVSTCRNAYVSIWAY